MPVETSAFGSNRSVVTRSHAFSNGRHALRLAKRGAEFLPNRRIGERGHDRRSDGLVELVQQLEVAGRERPRPRGLRFLLLGRTCIIEPPSGPSIRARAATSPRAPARALPENSRQNILLRASRSRAPPVHPLPCEPRWPPPRTRPRDHAARANCAGASGTANSVKRRFQFACSLARMTGQIRCGIAERAAIEGARGPTAALKVC